MTSPSALDGDALRNSFTGARCLVTGGAGFIGSNLVRSLADAGAIVAALDDLSTGKRENVPSSGVRLIHGDVASFGGLGDLVHASDYVFHLAAQVGNVRSLDQPVSDALSNIVGTVHLLDAARRSSVRRIIYSSSSAIFGEAEHLPVDEQHPKRPASFYALSKLTGEEYALLAASRWSLPVVCLRYFNVYGHPSENGEYSGVIPIFFRRLSEGETLIVYGDGRQSRDFVYVQDVVQALLRAAILGTAGAVYNIGNGQATTIADLAAAIGETASQPPTIETREARVGEVRHSVADITKARRDLGFEPQYDLRRGLAEYRVKLAEAARQPANAEAPCGRILVLIQSEDEQRMLASFRFDAFGFEPVCTPPRFDLEELLALVRMMGPVACLALSSGPGAALLALACGIETIPLFSMIASEADFDAIPIADSSQQRVFFLSTIAVLVRARTDSRYGLSLLPAGHPSEEGAADRMLEAIRAHLRGHGAPEQPQLTVVVPAYREASNLDLVCDRMLRVFGDEDIGVEILLIDDASPDETYEVALRQMWKSPRIRAFTKPTPRGMGNAIRYGIDRARSPFIAVTMGDGSDQVERLPEMYRQVADGGHALVIGSRYRARENYEAVPRLYRFWSRLFRLTAWAVAGFRLTDYTNAFRVFDRRIFARYGPESGGFEISPEITFKAWFATRRVVEVDVRHLKRASGQSTFSFLRAGPGYGKILAKAFVNRLTGRWITLDW